MSNCNTRRRKIKAPARTGAGTETQPTGGAVAFHRSLYQTHKSLSICIHDLVNQAEHMAQHAASADLANRHRHIAEHLRSWANERPRNLA